MFKREKNELLISTDKSLLDLELIHNYLKESYWAKGLPRKIFEKSLENSLCFGVFKQGKQIGFARVVSDYSTFAYLGDVFIIEYERGKGISKWLLEVILEHPELQDVRRFCLGTKDAQGLYQQFGFDYLKEPATWMEIKKENPYL